MAPLFAGEKSRKIILPKGKWYDFYTGKLVGEEQIIEVTSNLDNIPVFVRDGGIIPMSAISETMGKSNLIVRHYGEKTANYKLYDDDGETFDYEKGAYSWRNIFITKNNKGILTGTISTAENDKPNSFDAITFEFMTK